MNTKWDDFSFLTSATETTNHSSKTSLVLLVTVSSGSLNRTDQTWRGSGPQKFRTTSSNNWAIHSLILKTVQLLVFIQHQQKVPFWWIKSVYLKSNVIIYDMPIISDVCKKSFGNLLPPLITVGLDLITPRFLLLLFFESGFFDLISLSLASILGLT